MAIFGLSESSLERLSTNGLAIATALATMLAVVVPEFSSEEEE